MSLITKPMLAPTNTPSDFVFPIPCLATPKFDGIRCIVTNGQILSRTFKLIPNRWVQQCLQGLPEELDGELVAVDKDGNPLTFNQTQSAVMRESGQSDFIFFIFDYVKSSLSRTYKDRMKDLEELDLSGNSYCRKVLPQLISSKQELDEYEEKYLALGFEGVMVRLAAGPYKCGRATLNQGSLIKVKRFCDSEFRITNFVELMHNTNEAELDAFGRTKRSSNKAGLVSAGTLGKFLGEELGDVPWKGKIIEVGTGRGLTAKLRQEIWDNQAKYLGKISTYKYQKHGSTIDKPRLPIWKGFRDESDM